MHVTNGVTCAIHARIYIILWSHTFYLYSEDVLIKFYKSFCYGYYYTHFMLGIDVYYTITIPAWFITRKYHINETILLVLVRALLEYRPPRRHTTTKQFFRALLISFDV